MRIGLGFFSAMLLVMAGKHTLPAQNGARIGPESQLFLDNMLIASERGVWRTLHVARKEPAPILEPEMPWEGQRVYLFGTVLYDSDRQLFQMWYNSTVDTRRYKVTPSVRDAGGSLTLYATSEDGLHWTRPDLGVYLFDGSPANNIVDDMDSPSVILDVSETDRAKRYKMLGYRSGARKGYYAAYSADGLRWTDYAENPVLEHSDTITLAQDNKTRRYLAFHRRPADIRGYGRRVVWLSTSSNFQDWSKPKLILAPDASDDSWAYGSRQRTEFYIMSGFRVGGRFLGFLTALRLTQGRAPGQLDLDRVQSRDDGPADIQLIYSNDGSEWRRFYDRSPIVPRGEFGSFDGGMVLAVANTPIIVNDEVWLYYSAFNTTHGGPMPPKRVTIGRASWRLDGFVSLDSDSQGGVVETVPLRLSGDHLEINVDASHGSAAVEVLSSDGAVLPGYSLRDCQPVATNKIHQIIRWKSTERLPSDSPIRLRFHLRDVRLYSFRIS